MLNQPLRIEINMKTLRESKVNRNADQLLIEISDEEEEEEKSRQYYFEIKDNGVGIHPVQFKDMLTTFGSNNIQQTKNDFNLSEHGINMKLSALRLGSTVLIITKTKP